MHIASGHALIAGFGALFVAGNRLPGSPAHWPAVISARTQLRTRVPLR